MKYAVLTTAFLFVFTAFAPAAYSKGVEGIWLTKKRDVAVRISRCGDSGREVCGHIVWLSPETAQSEPSLCGVRVLWGAKEDRQNPAHFSGGTLYKADDDQYYGAELSLKNQNTLALRGYLGFPALGKTKTLTRATTLPSHSVC